MDRIQRVDQRRARCLQEGTSGDGPVVYWLNRDQRVADNWALLYAQDLALRGRRGLVVIFCLQQEFLAAADRHFAFMLSGLQELEKSLIKLSIPLSMFAGTPEHIVPEFLKRVDAHSLVTDFNPLRIKQRWQQQVADNISLPYYEVDAHNIIPCRLVSDKREYGAYTLRPKVHMLLAEFLTEFPQVMRHPHGCGPDKIPPPDWKKLGRFVKQDYRDAWPVAGEQMGKELLAEFVGNRLNHYDDTRNNPLKRGQSGLSPYFHFGMLAPQRAALEVEKAKQGGDTNTEAYLEELIVRRELSDNFCYYCPDYDSIEAFPDWAIKSLELHRNDTRDYLYSEEEFSKGQTHEPLWNACQHFLESQGRLHGYLRMYWAKKILEWSESPEEALRIAIYLNDSLAFDGRDPNGYTGIAWSIGGVHDRAWKERPVFGKVRFMNEKGCRRKFKVDDYIAQVSANSHSG